MPRLLPTASALIIFFVVSALYFAPQFQGKVLPQHDVMQYEGMAKDINQMRSTTGEDPQWTGGMFSGMPAYLINVAYPAQIIKTYLGKVTKTIDTPAGFLFFAMTSMWLMLLIFGVNPWIGIIASLAYGLSTYFLLIIGAGHITKMWALVYAPMMMGGAWMTLRGNMLYGAALTGVFTSLEIGANHPQISYYFILAMAAMWLSELIFAIREHLLPRFARRTAVLAVVGILAAVSNFSPLWYTAQHTKDTIRGGSELTSTVETSNEGLALDYATAWSYGRAESFNLLIPDFMGRQSATTFPSDGNTAAILNEYGLRGAERQLPMYWGDQPYTGGPTYLGASVLFLALLGVMLLAGRNKWWIIGVSILMLFLAWGRHWMGLTELAFDYLPGYNKFRTVSMTLVVVQWAVPLLAALGLMQLWKGGILKQKFRKAVISAFALTGGLSLLFAVAGGLFFDFGEKESAEMMTEQFNHIFRANQMQDYIDRGMDIEWGETVATAMAMDRQEMMQSDAMRSVLIILLAAGLVVLFYHRKVNRWVLVGGLGAIILFDLTTVDLRFLSGDNFVNPRQQRVMASAADKEILEDRDLGYRVLNLTVSPFNDATTSYFHRSIGGYHGAKLARYQDLIDRYLTQMDDNVLDMLNTRYVIVPSKEGYPEAQMRSSANGVAWFVDNVVYADSPQQEIDLLGEVDTKLTAVLRDDLEINEFGEGEIRMTAYQPNHLTYEYSATKGGLAVFSEIFYNKGWHAYIDGKEMPYFRCDYVLRAMQLPAGDHRVEWKFRAPQWNMVEGITLGASVLILILALVALGVWTKKATPKN